MDSSKTADIKDFTSRWEYSKATSNWHFDKFKNEDLNPPFKKIGIVESDFTDLVQYSLNSNRPICFGNRLGKENLVPYTIELDRADLEKTGYGENHTLFNRAKPKKNEQYPFRKQVESIIQFLGLENPFWCVHVQYPGQVFPLHIDNLTSLRNNEENHPINSNPDLAARFEIQLLDWEWGHIWGYGNTHWKQWKKGEIVYHKWRDIPHYTANAGQSPRLSLQLTGLTTSKTNEIINEPNPITIVV